MCVKDKAVWGFRNFGEEIFHKALYASSAEFCFILLTIGIAATEVCVNFSRINVSRLGMVFKKNLWVISKVNIVAMKAC